MQVNYVNDVCSDISRAILEHLRGVVVQIAVVDGVEIRAIPTGAQNVRLSFAYLLWACSLQR